MPVSQVLMFESLDSVLPTDDTTDANINTDNGGSPDPSLGPVIPNKNGLARTAVEAVYGAEIAAELAGLKVFVVGSGAIGCELMKTFALMNMCIGDGGSGSRGSIITGGGGSGIKVVSEGVEPEIVDSTVEKDDAGAIGVSGSGSGGLWQDLMGGGVVLADMDSIERSNLNRYSKYSSPSIISTMCNYHCRCSCILADECI